MAIMIFIVINCYSQDNSLEFSTGFKMHDFANSAISTLITNGRGKIKYNLVLGDSARVELIKIIKNDFDDTVEIACSKEIRSLEFIYPSFLKKGDKYRMTAIFKFNKRFKSFYLSYPKKIDSENTLD